MIDKIYTLLVVMIPIINMYALPGGIPFGTVLLFVYVLFMGIHGMLNKGSINLSACGYFLPFLFYLIFNFIMTLILDIGLLGEITVNTIHFIVFLFFSFFISKNHLDFPFAVKAVKIISIISIVFANVQIMLYRATGIFIPGTIPGLPLMSKMTDQLYYHIRMGFWAREDIRSHSFYSEPQHYCIYISVALVFYLFLKEELDKKDWIGAAFISIGLITSRSTTGYIFLALLWGIKLWTILKKSLLKNKISVYLSLGIFIGLPAAATVVLNSSFFEATYNRTFGIDSGGYSGVEAHLGNADKVIDMLFESPYRFMFGYGMIEPDFYYTSLMKVLFSFGIIGTILLFIGILTAMYKGNRMQRIIGIMILINCIGGETLLTVPYCLIYLSLIIIKIDELPFSENKYLRNFGQLVKKGC